MFHKRCFIFRVSEWAFLLDKEEEELEELDIKYFIQKLHPFSAFGFPTTKCS